MTYYRQKSIVGGYVVAEDVEVDADSERPETKIENEFDNGSRWMRTHWFCVGIVHKHKRPFGGN